MTRVNDSTWLESRFLVTRTRLEPRYLRNDSIRREFESKTRDSSQSLESESSLWWANPVRLHTKKWAFLLQCHERNIICRQCWIGLEWQNSPSKLRVIAVDGRIATTFSISFRARPGVTSFKNSQAGKRRTSFRGGHWTWMTEFAFYTRAGDGSGGNAKFCSGAS